MANEAENEGSFPGAYSGQGRSWERKTREAIGLLPEKYGFQPKVVLSTRAPATITATAVEVPMCERQQFGSSYIGVKDSSGLITPRKLAASLATPALGLHSTPPFTPATSSTSGAILRAPELEHQHFRDAADALLGLGQKLSYLVEPLEDDCGHSTECSARLLSVATPAGEVGRRNFMPGVRCCRGS